MANFIYSSNGNNSILKDLGPHKQQISDNSMNGLFYFNSEKVTNEMVFGEKIIVAPQLIDTSVQIIKKEEEKLDEDAV